MNKFKLLIQLTLTILLISCKQQTKEVKPSIVFSISETYFDDNTYTNAIIDSIRYSKNGVTYNITYYTFTKSDNDLIKESRIYYYKNGLLIKEEPLADVIYNYNTVKTNSINYNFSLNGYYNTVIVLNNSKVYCLQDKKKYGYIPIQNR